MSKGSVLISGGGIAGFTLAYWLKERGYTPTIIEKHPYLREGGYKVDVRGTALEVAKRMGIHDELLQSNVNINDAKLITSDFDFIELDGDLLGHCSEGDIEVNRFDLIQILAKAAGDIEVIFDDSITEIGEKVYFEKMAPRAFDQVVGADGVYSNVRQLAFGEDTKYLRKYGIHFCVFPVSNFVDLDRSEEVFFKEGKLATVYRVGDHSYACLALKSDDEVLQPAKIEMRFSQMGWKVPELLAAMKDSVECYYNSLAQVRMDGWSKGNVALVGDAAYAASAMGTSLAMVGAYVLAEELDNASGDNAIAFAEYERSLRTFVENAQDLVESNHQLFDESSSSIGLRLKLHFIKLMPKWFVQLMTKKDRKRMQEVANGYVLNEDLRLR